MTGVTIRAAAAEDVPAIVRIAERGWQAAYGDFLSQETIDIAMGEWYDPDTTQEIIEREGVAYFVAEQNGDLLGYASSGPSNEETIATLGAIYVDPDHWGEGIGTVLLEEFEEFCRQRAYDAIRFQVLAENDVGISFYRACHRNVLREGSRVLELLGVRVETHRFLSGNRHPSPDRRWYLSDRLRESL